MRTSRIIAVSLLTAGLVVGSGLGGGAVKSGPQAGDRIPGPFHPLNINGTGAGKKHCLVCEHGTSPVAMVFAREVSPPLTKLIKKLDAVTAKNTSCNMGSFVVFLSDKEGLENQLKKLVGDEKIKSLQLAIDNPAGPEGYKVAKEADITVVLYQKHMVAVNQTFRKGELNDKFIDQIVSDVARILPK